MQLQEEANGSKGQGPLRAKRQKKTRRPSQRGIPMREEFFAKIVWTRSSISGPGDPIYNPHMVWCHMCKKNFSIKSKWALEILRHHRTERHLRPKEAIRTFEECRPSKRESPATSPRAQWKNLDENRAG